MDLRRIFWGFFHFAVQQFYQIFVSDCLVVDCADSGVILWVFSGAGHPRDCQWLGAGAFEEF